MACYRFIGLPEKPSKNLIVDFSDHNIGTVVVDDWGEYKVGEVSITWITYLDNDVWEPCEDPRESRTNRMLKALK